MSLVGHICTWTLYSDTHEQSQMVHCQAGLPLNLASPSGCVRGMVSNESGYMIVVHY